MAVTQSAPSASSGAPRTVFYRGSRLGAREFARIQRVIEGRPGLMREGIAREVCRRFQWARPNGQFAVSSCRLLVLRLARRGFIQLPAARRPGNGAAPRRAARGPEAGPGGLEPGVAGAALTGALVVRPIQPAEYPGWRSLMARDHYLGRTRSRASTRCSPISTSRARW
ncbi:MAG: hypothetical protein A2X51_15285 [Candidatus Rokubacteria bacterium GWC2_70_24]|nr:MAG: hypothetical protein A2X51_15285 [Candidatus Rokubacteria bacterium GWC2_70_24]